MFDTPDEVIGNRGCVQVDRQWVNSLSSCDNQTSYSYSDKFERILYYLLQHSESDEVISVHKICSTHLFFP